MNILALISISPVDPYCLYKGLHDQASLCPHISVTTLISRIAHLLTVSWKPYGFAGLFPFPGAYRPPFNILANCYLLSKLGSSISSSKKTSLNSSVCSLELSIYLSLLLTVEDRYSLMYLSSPDYKFIKTIVTFIFIC